MLRILLHCDSSSSDSFFICARNALHLCPIGIGLLRLLADILRYQMANVSRQRAGVSSFKRDNKKRTPQQETNANLHLSKGVAVL
jgi:hypothetical protein